MRKSSIFLAAAVLLVTPTLQAATEYLRFEGMISPFYDEYSSGYEATLGFLPSQQVYFDFVIDTDLAASGYPDGAYQDFFAATYLGGSVPGSAVTRGVTSTFPEGNTTWLYITNTLMVGTTWDSLANPSDESIGTWSVGDVVQLMNYSYFSDNVIGNLTMSYRGATQPPAYVPVPAAAWLFGSGLAFMFSLPRRKS